MPGKGRPKTRKEPLSKAVQIRCSPSWHEWASGVARMAGRPLSEVMVDCFEGWARRAKHAKAPER